MTSRTTPIATSRNSATNKIVKVAVGSILRLIGKPDHRQRDNQEQSDERKPRADPPQSSCLRDRCSMLFVKGRPLVKTRALRNRAAALEIPGLRAIDELADF